MTKSEEVARKVVESIIGYSFINKEDEPIGCEHVKEFPDFQTWRNIVAKALQDARREENEACAKVADENSCYAHEFCEEECCSHICNEEIATAIRNRLKEGK